MVAFSGMFLGFPAYIALLIYLAQPLISRLGDGLLSAILIVAIIVGIIGVAILIQWAKFPGRKPAPAMSSRRSPDADPHSTASTCIPSSAWPSAAPIANPTRNEAVLRGSPIPSIRWTMQSRHEYAAATPPFTCGAGQSRSR